MQCKDISDSPILEWLHKRKLDDKIWATWYPGYENSIGVAMPEETPNKLKIRKMAMLIRRGFVDGCSCGCRGDYEITNEGIAFLEAIKPDNFLPTEQPS